MSILCGSVLLAKAEVNGVGSDFTGCLRSGASRTTSEYRRSVQQRVHFPCQFTGRSNSATTPRSAGNGQRPGGHFAGLSPLPPPLLGPPSSSSLFCPSPPHSQPRLPVPPWWPVSRTKKPTCPCRLASPPCSRIRLSIPSHAGANSDSVGCNLALVTASLRL